MIFGILGAASLVVPVAAVTVPADLNITIEEPIRAAVAAHQLQPPFDRAARQYAAAYVYTIVCKGVGAPDAFRSIEATMQADPKVPYQAAVLAILGIYVRAMPSGPDSAVCAKAFEDATRK